MRGLKEAEVFPGGGAVVVITQSPGVGVGVGVPTPRGAAQRVAYLLE